MLHSVFCTCQYLLFISRGKAAHESESRSVVFHTNPNPKCSDYVSSRVSRVVLRSRLIFACLVCAHTPASLANKTIDFADEPLR